MEVHAKQRAPASLSLPVSLSLSQPVALTARLESPWHQDARASASAVASALSSPQHRPHHPSLHAPPPPPPSSRPPAPLACARGGQSHHGYQSHHAYPSPSAPPPPPSPLAPWPQPACRRRRAAAAPSPPARRMERSNGDSLVITRWQSLVGNYSVGWKMGKRDTREQKGKTTWAL